MSATHSISSHAGTSGTCWHMWVADIVWVDSYARQSMSHTHTSCASVAAWPSPMSGVSTRSMVTSYASMRWCQMSHTHTHTYGSMRWCRMNVLPPRVWCQMWWCVCCLTVRAAACYRRMSSATSCTVRITCGMLSPHVIYVMWCKILSCVVILCGVILCGAFTIHRMR